MTRSLLIDDVEGTRRLGRILGRRLQAGDVLCLIGDLGAGKTTFTQALAEGLDVPVDDVVNSPTFTLVAEHWGGRVPLFHFDVYRLHGADDLEDLAFDDYLDGRGVVVMEWADKVLPALPPDRLEISFAEGKSAVARIITLTAAGARARSFAGSARRMTFLAMDTGGEYAVLVLGDEESGAVKDAVIFEGKRTLSRRLLGEVDGLLQRHKLTLADLTGLAVGLGPGSFTGLRVGLATVKTLAQVTGLPLVGFGSLAAYAAVWDSDSGLAIVPTVASRRNEVYAACFVGRMETAPSRAVVSGDFEPQVREWAAGRSIVICGSSDGFTVPGAHRLLLRWTPPEGVSRLAAERLRLGERDDVYGLVPAYVVAPAITTPKPII